VIGIVPRERFCKIGCGVAIGIPMALGAGRLLASRLYGIRVNDPLVLGGATPLLFACALMAGLIPARGATQVDSMDACALNNSIHISAADGVERLNFEGELV